MLFEPNLKQCKLEQNYILQLWKNDEQMKTALNNVIDVFLIPKSIVIYNEFSFRENVTYISKYNFYDEFIKFMGSFYKKDDIFYILYSGNTSRLNKFGFREQSYPIFSITYKNLVDHWLHLVNIKDFFSLIISDIHFNTVIDISDIDNHAENSNNKNDYTISFKTKKYQQT